MLAVTLARPSRCPNSSRIWRSSSSRAACPLSGEIAAAGNKNAALPILAACLLTEEELVLRNVPRIRDTETQIALLEGIGVEGRAGPAATSVRLQADSVTGRDRTRSSRARSAPRSCSPGPLLARFGEARMPPPGGDSIGRRRLDPHLDAFRDLGAKVAGDRWIELTAPADGPPGRAGSSWTSPR